jgi:hypothetical protein
MEERVELSWKTDWRYTTQMDPNGRFNHSENAELNLVQLKCDDQWNFGFNSMVDVLWNLSSLMKRGDMKQV